MDTEHGTITITEITAPSRSKGRGWAYLDGDHVERTFASTSGRTTADLGDTIDLVLGCEIRRATRTTKERDAYTLTVTGDPTDTVEIWIGSPQPYTVTVTGATR